MRQSGIALLALRAASRARRPQKMLVHSDGSRYYVARLRKGGEIAVLFLGIALTESEAEGNSPTAIALAPSIKRLAQIE